MLPGGAGDEQWQRRSSGYRGAGPREDRKPVDVAKRVGCERETTRKETRRGKKQETREGPKREKKTVTEKGERHSQSLCKSLGEYDGTEPSQNHWEELLLAIAPPPMGKTTRRELSLIGKGMVVAFFRPSQNPHR